MDRMHDDRDGIQLAAGWKTAAAVVVIALLVAAGERSLESSKVATPATAEAAAPPASDYFPSGYTLDAFEPEEHVEAF